MEINDKVYFGRSNGERTLGEVVKVNRASIKVRQLESRGTMKSYPVGTIWKVAPALVYPASADATPALNEIWSEAVVADPPKRGEADILADIRSCYLRMEPERLSADGERSYAQQRVLYAQIQKVLLSLFNELGRIVTEAEALA